MELMDQITHDVRMGVRIIFTKVARGVGVRYENEECYFSIDTSWDGTMIIYADENVDITDLIAGIKRYKRIMEALRGE